MEDSVRISMSVRKGLLARDPSIATTQVEAINVWTPAVLRAMRRSQAGPVAVKGSPDGVGPQTLPVSGSRSPSPLTSCPWCPA